MTDAGSAVLLGAVQGVAEFLPISSSAHLALLPRLLHWESPLLSSLAFDVALHIGTLVAVLACFRQELCGMARALLHPRTPTPELKLAGWIALGTLPIVAVALIGEHAVEGFFREPARIAWCLILVSLVMAVAEHWSRRQRGLDSLGWSDALLLGAAQALALAPGVSRSGITIVAALFLGYRREEAARFSFLLSIPAILGATLLEGRKLLSLASSPDLIVLLVGGVTAAGVGYAAVRWFLDYLNQRTLYPFVAYRLALGIGVLIWVATQNGSGLP